MTRLRIDNTNMSTEKFTEKVQGVHGLWYKKDENDIYYLDIKDDDADEEELYINPWGFAHERYIKTHRRAFYYSLITSGELRKYLAQISGDASDRYSLIVKQMADADPAVTEGLKAAEQLTWTARMNNICSRAREIVNTELIYA